MTTGSPVLSPVVYPADRLSLLIGDGLIPSPPLYWPITRLGNLDALQGRPPIVSNAASGVLHLLADGTLGGDLAGPVYNPILQHDPDGSNPRLLSLPAFTNLLLAWDEFDNAAYWSKTVGMSSISAAAITRGMGFSTITEAGSGTNIGVMFPAAGNRPVLAADTHLISMFIQAGTRRYVSFGNVRSAGVHEGGVTIDTTDMTITQELSLGNITVVSSAIKDMGTGIYRVDVVFSDSIGGAAQLEIGGAANGTPATIGTAYTQDGSTIIAGPAMLVAGIDYHPGVYIPTTTAAVAFTGSANVVAFQMAASGAAYVEFTPINVEILAPILTLELDGANNIKIIVGADLKLRLIMVVGGVAQVNGTGAGPVLVAGTTYKAAFRWALNDVACALDGALLYTDNAATTAAWTTVKPAAHETGNSQIGAVEFNEIRIDDAPRTNDALLGWTA